MSSHVLSKRASQTIRDLDTPWRFAPAATYDPDTNPDGLISFGLAENKLVDRELQEFARHVTIPAQAFSYAYSSGGGPELPAAMARHLNEYFSPFKPLDGSEISISGTATAMHEIIGWAVGEPGDCILTSRPVYGRFELDFGNKAELNVGYADTDPDSSFDSSVVQKFEEALAGASKAGRVIRALLIVNPNNPLGRCYPRDTLVALMKFCQKHSIHFISDEVYGCSVYNSSHPTLPPFTSALSIDPAGIIDTDLLHVTYGLSKDFGAAGLRVGALVTRSQAMHRAVKSVTRFHNVSGPSVAIAAAMLNDRAWCRGFIDKARTRMAAAYKHVTEALDAMEIKYVSANAGFFVYVDLSPYLKKGSSPGQEDPDFAIARKLMDAGVFLHPLEEHGPSGWFRVVFTQDPRTVTEGLRRLKAVVRPC
ncbi:Uu.00g035470.m01.CDS01 [Anthostomella pinea]|uniref:Uu.00g035470.m01.CDS01 n=1 Tax=Anthostomella pinea TaxID=933095 RepID=A0AAI8V943_9PEZI|nr:Uu.00g035470.m01.CDS01 [Anthostomella pinea]